jgi:hypothetical protein
MPDLIDGAKIKMGGKDWVVPALSFKQLKRLLPRLNKIGGGDLSPDNMGDMAEVVHAALSRNYPELTLDEVEDMLDMRCAQFVFMAVIGQSGLEARPEGEAKPGSR